METIVTPIIFLISMDIEKIKNEAYAEAMQELKKKYSKNEEVLDRLKKYEVKENGKGKELLARQKS